MPDLSGRTAIVTGASRGIGLAIATALRRDGAFVCITGRKHARWMRRQELLALMGAAVGNTADPTHRNEVVSAVIREFGRVDMLVNNVGINPVFGPLVDTELRALTKIYDTNVVSALGWIQETYHQSMNATGGANRERGLRRRPAS